MCDIEICFYGVGVKNRGKIRLEKSFREKWFDRYAEPDLHLVSKTQCFFDGIVSCEICLSEISHQSSSLSYQLE